MNIKTGNKILAHRGFWIHSKEKNTKGALLRALKRGYGIETDIREGVNENLIISHDPLFIDKGKEELPVRWLLEQAKKYNDYSCLALNIKADGLLPELCRTLSEYQIKNYFTFDMSLPDAVSASEVPIKQYDRLSIYETSLSGIKRRDGIWLDTYDKTYPNLERIENLILTEPNVVLVSPELHGREHLQLWYNIKNIFMENTNLSLCTDFPEEAYHFFNS